jgi:hypothetical protein
MVAKIIIYGIYFASNSLIINDFINILLLGLVYNVIEILTTNLKEIFNLAA